MPLTLALLAPVFLVGIALILFGPILVEILTRDRASTSGFGRSRRRLR